MHDQSSNGTLPVLGRRTFYTTLVLLGVWYCFAGCSPNEETLEQRLARRENELGELQVKNGRLKHELKDVTAELQHLRKEHERLSTRADKLKKQNREFAELLDKMADFETKRHAMMRELKALNKLKQKNHELHEAQKRYDAFLEKFGPQQLAVWFTERKELSEAEFSAFADIRFEARLKKIGEDTLQLTLPAKFFNPVTVPRIRMGKVEADASACEYNMEQKKASFTFENKATELSDLIKDAQTPTLFLTIPYAKGDSIKMVLEPTVEPDKSLLGTTMIFAPIRINFFGTQIEKTDGKWKRGEFTNAE